jgi:hypothetical protein
VTGFVPGLCSKMNLTGSEAIPRESKIVLVCDSASAHADALALAEDPAKQLGGVLDADLLHDVRAMPLDGARA